MYIYGKSGEMKVQEVTGVSTSLWPQHKGGQKSHGAARPDVEHFTPRSTTVPRASISLPSFPVPPLILLFLFTTATKNQESARTSFSSLNSLIPELTHEVGRADDKIISSTQR
jgi:hypothetical protein